jgi:hypothetical protein
VDRLQAAALPDPGLPRLLLDQADGKARKMQEGFDVFVIPDGGQRKTTFGKRFHLAVILPRFG